MLNIEEDRTQTFCTYCGAKALIHNENEFTYRHVDVADLERAETERTVKLKEMELAEKRRLEKEKTRSTRIKYAIILFVLGIVLLGIGFSLLHYHNGLAGLSIVGYFPLLAAMNIYNSIKKDGDDS